MECGDGFSGLKIKIKYNGNCTQVVTEESQWGLSPHWAWSCNGRFWGLPHPPPTLQGHFLLPPKTSTCFTSWRAEPSIARELAEVVATRDGGPSCAPIKDPGGHTTLPKERRPGKTGINLFWTRRKPMKCRSRVEVLRRGERKTTVPGGECGCKVSALAFAICKFTKQNYSKRRGCSAAKQVLFWTLLGTSFLGGAFLGGKQCERTLPSSNNRWVIKN